MSMLPMQRKLPPYMSQPNPFDQAPVAQDPGVLPVGGGMDMGAMPQMQVRKPGMFGGGGGKILDVLANALAGYSAGMGNQGGMAILQGLQQRRQAMMQAQQDNENYQRQREDGMEDWKAKQQWQLEHPDKPAPTQTDRYLAELQDPNTPEFRKKLLAQVLFPPVIGTVNGSSAMIDRGQLLMGGQPMPNAGGSDDDWEYSNGGPTPPASGGFPR